MAHELPQTTAPSTNYADCPFLRLPCEIRLRIYTLLFFPTQSTDLRARDEKVAISLQDSFDYEKKLRGTDRMLDGDLQNPTLLIRTIEGGAYTRLYGPSRLRGEHLRKKYGVSARFRTRYMMTTYHCVNNPRLEKNMGIMAVNRQVHSEAAELLYGSYTFDFDTHVEAIVPFFTDLTSFARSCVKSIRFVKRGLAYDREYDRAEWNNALQFLTTPISTLNLKTLELGIVAGKPGERGWDNIATYSADEFALMKGADGMQWALAVLRLKDCGLRGLEVTAVVEHCPPATNSMAMAAFIRFSASIETGFRDYLRGVVLAEIPEG